MRTEDDGSIWTGAFESDRRGRGDYPKHVGLDEEGAVAGRQVLSSKAAPLFHRGSIPRSERRQGSKTTGDLALHVGMAHMFAVLGRKRQLKLQWGCCLKT